MSKVWCQIERFSEDIDLAVDRSLFGMEGDLTKKQIKKLRKMSSLFVSEEFCPVGRVHSHDVHAGEEQMAKEVLLTVLVADGAYYFCLFHALSFFMLLQRYKKNA